MEWPVVIDGLMPLKFQIGFFFSSSSSNFNCTDLCSITELMTNDSNNKDIRISYPYYATTNRLMSETTC